MKNSIIMLGTSLKAKGGISSVIEIYNRHNLFSQWPIHYIPTHVDGSRLEKTIILFSSIVKFLLILITKRVKLVHIHTASRSSFFRKSIFLLICKIFKIQYIVHLHGGRFLNFYNHECSKLTRNFIYWIFTSASSVIVLSNTWKNAILNTFHGSKVRILHNPSRFLDIPPKDRTGRTILFCGKLGKLKGIYDLLNAFSQIITIIPNAHLICCGDGEISECKQQANTLNLSSHIDIIGWVEQNKLKQILAQTDIFVLPSYDEGLPMSLLEAMAASIAVITTPVGGIPDLIKDEENGFLIQPGDIEALTNRLIVLLTDPMQRSAIAANAHKTIIENYAPKEIIARLGKIYREFGIEPTSSINS